MSTKILSRKSEFYNKLFSHCQQQYPTVAHIEKAYMSDGKVYAIYYIKSDGVHSIAFNTAVSELFNIKIVIFK